MTEANTLVKATRICLPVHHPLRMCLKPFEYRIVSVNAQAASSLVNERGLVSRIWAFDYEEYLRVIELCTMNHRFTLLPDRLDPSMRDEPDDKFPIQRDANAFWAVIRRYIEGFIEEYYPRPQALFEDRAVLAWIDEVCIGVGLPGIEDRDRFIDVLTQLVVNSTGWHQHVGHVSEYMFDPSFVGCKLEKGKRYSRCRRTRRSAHSPP